MIPRPGQLKPQAVYRAGARLEQQLSAAVADLAPEIARPRVWTEVVLDAVYSVGFTGPTGWHRRPFGADQPQSGNGAYPRLLRAHFFAGALIVEAYDGPLPGRTTGQYRDDLAEIAARFNALISQLGVGRASPACHMAAIAADCLADAAADWAVVTGRQEVSDA